MFDWELMTIHSYYLDTKKVFDPIDKIYQIMHI